MRGSVVVLTIEGAQPHDDACVTLKRYLDKVCEACHGAGQRSYSSTATWRGGMGGQTTRSDVCDKCWGTGDELNPGYNIREAEATFRERVTEEAARTLADAMGAGISSMNAAHLFVADQLDAISRKRKAPAFTDALCACLARELRSFSQVKP